jgi:hypothetical protein
MRGFVRPNNNPEETDKINQEEFLFKKLRF